MYGEKNLLCRFLRERGTYALKELTEGRRRGRGDGDRIADVLGHCLLRICDEEWKVGSVDESQLLTE